MDAGSKGTDGAAAFGGALERYPARAGTFDEMLAGPGAPRAHWQGLVRSLAALGPPELARRFEQARRLAREDGAALRARGDPGGPERPWPVGLDPIPLLIPAEEWTAIEAGLGQRARLLNLILRDLYGPQALLGEGLLPPALVLPNPGFLRPCHGIRPAAPGHLVLYAAELARSPEGGYRVVADRTEVPAAGAGYALENRAVVSRTLADAFRDLRVRPLAAFYRTLREALSALAPPGGGRRRSPRIALFTAGPTDPSHREHACLARHLECALVEAGDLAVRDDAVFEKTIGGLKPIEVILRGVEDALCDPLELRADSPCGVAGLVQAARAGHVAIGNALGSGLVESAPLGPFLPEICRRLLGEELRLPSSRTWWCGRPLDLAYVIDRMDRLVIRPAWPGLGVEACLPLPRGEGRGEGVRSPKHEHGHGHGLGQEEKARLIGQIRARPHAFAGEEPVGPSTTPVLVGSGLEPRPFHLRVLVVGMGDSYVAMPAVRGKDVWVLSAGPASDAAPEPTLPIAGSARDLRRSDDGGDGDGADLPSRAADGLYWLGRYAERAEGAVRLLRSIAARLAEEPEPAHTPGLPSLQRALAHVGGIRSGPLLEGRASGAARLERETEIVSLVFDGERVGSVRATLGAARQAAATVADRLPLDASRVLLELEEGLGRPEEMRTARLRDALVRLDRLAVGLAALSGLGAESMARGQGSRFLEMGRRLERAIHTAGLLRSTLVAATAVEAGPGEIEAVLEASESLAIHRSRYRSRPSLARALDLLLKDETNPRSVAFQLAALASHLAQLPARGRRRRSTGPERRIALTALASLRVVDAQELCGAQGGAGLEDLERLLADLETKLPALSDALTHGYLSHAEPPQQLAADPPGEDAP